MSPGSTLKWNTTISVKIFICLLFMVIFNPIPCHVDLTLAKEHRLYITEGKGKTDVNLWVI